MLRTRLLPATLLLSAMLASAGGGPHEVLVVVNENSQELLFPDDWSDVTADDTGGDPAGDPGVVHTPSGSALSWHSVVAEGSDGGLGP